MGTAFTTTDDEIFNSSTSLELTTKLTPTEFTTAEVEFTTTSETIPFIIFHCDFGTASIDISTKQINATVNLCDGLKILQNTLNGGTLGTFVAEYKFISPRIYHLSDVSSISKKLMLKRKYFVLFPL